MSITPMSPAISQQGWVQTWVTSQWKNRPIPGQFSAEINSLVTSGKVKATLPTDMTDAQKKMLDDLQAMKSDEFMEKYHSEQVDAHKDAVDLFERYGKEGEQPDLKAWAESTLPTLKHHLDMAKALNK